MKIFYYFSVMHEFFTDLSIELHKDRPDLKCTGYAYGKKDCFEKFPFEDIVYFSSIDYKNSECIIDYSFLKDLESKYGFNISELIHAERNFETIPVEKRLFVAQEMIRQCKTRLESFAPSLVVLEGLDDLQSLFLYYYCRHHEIEFYYFVYARLGSYLIKSNRLDTGPAGFSTELGLLDDKDKYKKELDSTKAFIKEYTENKKQPSYVTRSSLLFKAISIEDFKIALKGFKNYFTDSNTFGMTNPLLYPFSRLKRINRLRLYKKTISKKSVAEEALPKNFFIYPLHFHPEAATLIQGRWFNDQLRIIEIISKALPADYTLVVKEHKVSIGRREGSFYKDVSEFHNVQFISHTADVYNLLDKSKGVITISSSMGLEALMTQKPVITFGDIFYNASKNVIKVRDLSRIPEYINAAIAQNPDFDDTAKVVTAFRKNLVEVTPGFSAHGYDDFSLNNIKKAILS